jgi:hypothetical protein
LFPKKHRLYKNREEKKIKKKKNRKKMSTLRPRGGGDDPELGAAPAPDPSTGKPAPFDSGSGLGGSGSGGSGLSGSGPGGSGPGGSGGGGGDGLGALLRRPAFVLVCLLSVLTRFVHLGHPPSVVFDEVHFGKFTNHYLTGHYYFDIHPPLVRDSGRGGGYRACE